MNFKKIDDFVLEIQKNNRINTNSWEIFKVGEIFNIFNGKGITKSDFRKYSNGTIPCIQGGEFNNGVLGYFPEKLCQNKKYCFIDEICISVARVGSVGAVNLQ